MTRVEGIRVNLPPGVRVNRDHVRAEEDRPRALRGLGYCTEFQAVDEHTFGFTFVATTERGEELARRMREGGCWMELMVPPAPEEGMTVHELKVHQLKIRIVWERDPPVMWHPDGRGGA